MEPINRASSRTPHLHSFALPGHTFVSTRHVHFAKAKFIMHPNTNTPFSTRCALTLTCIINVSCVQAVKHGDEGRHILSRNLALHFRRTISCYISGIAHVFLGCKKKKKRQGMGLMQLVDHSIHVPNKET